jgi:hypothetical protein
MKVFIIDGTVISTAITREVLPRGVEKHLVLEEE